MKGDASGFLRTLCWVSIACLAFGVLLPDVSWRGPLSYFDLLPLLGIGLAVPVIAHLGLPRLDHVVVAIVALIIVGVLVNLLRTNPLALGTFIRGPGRLCFYLAALLLTRVAAQHLGHRKVLALLAAAATLEALIGLWMFAAQFEGPYRTGVFFSRNELSLEYFTRAPRLAGTFNYEDGAGMNGLAAYLVLHIPIVVGLARTSQRQCSLWWLALVALVVALVLTFTRAGLVALIVACVAALVVSGRTARRAAFVALPCVLLALALLPSVRTRFLSSGTDRQALVAAGATIVAEHPYLGHGDVNYVDILFSRQDFVNTPFGPATATPHNALVMAGFRYGLIGFLLAFLLLSLPIAQAYAAFRSGGAASLWAKCAFVSFAAFFVQSLTNSLLDIPNVTLFYMLLLGAMPVATDPHYAHRTMGSSSS